MESMIDDLRAILNLVGSITFIVLISIVKANIASRSLALTAVENRFGFLQLREMQEKRMVKVVVIW